jgi:hypothetical protein
MATINLGRVKPVFRGAYNASTAYVIDDIVTYQNETYIAITATTGNLPTVTSNWTKLAAKGTDGTDVGTTLTTQGDILYRDASGLARLAAGTSGQVLQTGGSGANPSWGTVSSDMVKLAQNTTGNASSISIDGYFSSTYKSYKCIYDVQGQNNSTNFGLRFNVSGTTKTDSYYIYTGVRARRSSASNDINNDSGWDNSYAKLNNGSGNSNLRTVGEINFHNIGAGYPHFTALGASWNDNSNFYGYQMNGLYSGTTNPSGFTFFFDSSGNTIVRSITLYGLK